MDSNTGTCTSTPKQYSGPLAPLNGEVSWHFRGPLSLKQFAFYTPGSGSSQKREVKSNFHRRRHDHHHLHSRSQESSEAQEQKRAVGDIVTATINGQVVQWVNAWDGGAGSGSDAVAVPPAIPAAIEVAANSYHSIKSRVDSTAETPGASIKTGGASWSRQAYYNAQSGESSGLTFLNHNGGQGSGVFDHVFGNSLSYASSDGCNGSSYPQILEDKMLPDNTEIVIMTDKECTDGSCGAVRPGTVAFHGFDGASKVFLVEFSMPMTGKRGFNMDMPAAWILNAQIPRTLQYGKPECSCWKSGCGEWDIHEILDSGNTRGKSTIHGNVSGGSSHFFDRPVDKTMKMAIVFDGDSSSGHIKVLPDDTKFDTVLDGATVSDFCSESSQRGSVFRLAS
ncbi:hypothetical protein VTN02DRAFT_2008 [Thermoascus thermophilus]